MPPSRFALLQVRFERPLYQPAERGRECLDAEVAFGMRGILGRATALPWRVMTMPFAQASARCHQLRKSLTRLLDFDVPLRLLVYPVTVLRRVKATTYGSIEPAALIQKTLPRCSQCSRRSHSSSSAKRFSSSLLLEAGSRRSRGCALQGAAGRAGSRNAAGQARGPSVSRPARGQVFIPRCSPTGRPGVAAQLSRCCVRTTLLRVRRSARWRLRRWRRTASCLRSSIPARCSRSRWRSSADGQEAVPGTAWLDVRVRLFFSKVVLRSLCTGSVACSAG